MMHNKLTHAQSSRLGLPTAGLGAPTGSHESGPILGAPRMVGPLWITPRTVAATRQQFSSIQRNDQTLTKEESSGN